MLLQSIELINFRQFKNEKIEFSTDPDKNVTLIMGDNGTGKTTFAQAFFWCLYGETSFNDKVMLNRAVAERMTPDEKEVVKVILKLVYGSANYEITRIQEYRKSYSNKLTPSNSILSIGRKSEDGNFKYLKPLECEVEIKKILPKELSGYFFFDGERVEKMSKEIAAGKKSSEFSDAVIGLTGLKGMQSALAHLKPTSSSSVMGRFNSMYSHGSDTEITKLTNEIQALQEEIDRIDKRIDEITEQIESARVAKASFEEDIKQFADGERLQSERERLTKDLTEAKKRKAQYIKNACKFFNSEMTPFLSLSLTKKALETISKSDFGGKDIPEMHSKTIDYLLNRKQCICGTHLDPGTIPYEKVKSLKEFLPPQSIGVTVGQFIKDSRNKFVKPVELFNDIQTQLVSVSKEEDSISEYIQELDIISEKLDGKDVREQVKKLNNQIKTCVKAINEGEFNNKNLLQDKGIKIEQKRQKENRRAELSLQNKNNSQIEIYKAYAQRIYDDLFSEYNSRETEIRNELEKSINNIFKKIYNGGLSLTIDERYNVSVYANDFEVGVETSTAQSISVIFAFISAIIKMAKENQRRSGDVSYSEPYPLVMDAPLSAFDKRRIKAVCEAIPETAEQVIIFIKDTDGELAKEYLEPKIKIRHYFEKIDEFHTKLI